MIEMGKRYKTRDGRPVRILCTDREQTIYTVVALVGTEVLSYTADGKQFRTGESRSDLIEVKPRIVRELWVNVYPENYGDIVHKTKQKADSECAGYRIACIKVTIDCEEGEGL